MDAFHAHKQAAIEAVQRSAREQVEELREVSFQHALVALSRGAIIGVALLFVARWRGVSETVASSRVTTGRVTCDTLAGLWCTQVLSESHAIQLRNARERLFSQHAAELDKFAVEAREAQKKTRVEFEARWWIVYQHRTQGLPLTLLAQHNADAMLLGRRAWRRGRGLLGCQLCTCCLLVGVSAGTPSWVCVCVRCASLWCRCRQAGLSELHAAVNAETEQRLEVASQEVAVARRLARSEEEIQVLLERAEATRLEAADYEQQALDTHDTAMEELNDYKTAQVGDALSLSLSVSLSPL